MTPKQKDLLMPFAQRLAEIEQDVWDMDDAKLDDLIAAASAATTTNCWGAIFRVSRIILIEANGVKLNRKRPASTHG